MYDDVVFFYFIEAEKIIKDQQKIINKTLGLEIIGSDLITSDDIIMTPFTPNKPNLKVSILKIYNKFINFLKLDKKYNYMLFIIYVNLADDVNFFLVNYILIYHIF